MGEAALNETQIIADGIEMEYMDSQLIPQDKFDSETDAGVNDNLKALQDSGSMPYPIKIHSQVGEDIWWKLDDTFYVPKVNAYFQFYFIRDYVNHFDDSMSSEDKLDRLLVDDIYLGVWKELFMSHHFRNDMYRADEAECGMTFSTSQKSFKIEIDCFSDTLSSFVDTFAEKMSSFVEFDNEMVFKSIVEKVVRQQDDFWLTEPYKVARDYAQNILKVGNRPHHLYRKVLEQLDFNDFQDFCRTRIWDKLFVEAYFGGNILQEDCLGLYNTINSGFNNYKNYGKLKRSEWNALRQTRVWDLQPNQDHVYARITLNKNENNVGLLKHYQMEPNPEVQKALKEGYESLYMDPYALGDVLPMYNKNVARNDLIKRHMIFQWLSTWLANLFYKELRTEKQLGYVVDAFQVDVHGNMGFNFVVQSENTEPSNISAMIDKFVGDSEKILEDMTAEEFSGICSAAEKNRCAAPTSLAEQSYKFFANDILSHQYLFDCIPKYKEELGNLKKWEVQDIYRKMFLNDKKVLEVHIVSENMKEEANVNLRKRNHFHVGNVRQLHTHCNTLDDCWLFK